MKNGQTKVESDSCSLSSHGDSQPEKLTDGTGDKHPSSPYEFMVVDGSQGVRRFLVVETPLGGGPLVARLVLELVDDVDAENHAHQLEATEPRQDRAPDSFVIVHPEFEWGATSSLFELLGISEGVSISLRCTIIA